MSNLFKKLESELTHEEKIKYSDIAKSLLKHQNVIKRNELAKKYNFYRVAEEYYKGYGLKVLANDLNITYSNMRAMCAAFNIEIRKGYNISTDKTKEFRSKMAKTDKNPWKDWTTIRPEMIKNNSKGIQGYYIKKDGRKVWLRSTFEFIYAKWLDRNNIDWEIENKRYKLSNNYYLPDFTIFENNEIKYLVELKGFWDKGLEKCEEFKKLYNIPLIIIRNVNEYILENKNYKDEVKEWRKYASSSENKN